MADLGGAFKLFWDNSEKRKRNTIDSTNLLKAKCIPFESKNNGHHLVVQGKNSTFDFWPASGKFIDRNSPMSGRGVFNLVKLCK